MIYRKRHYTPPPMRAVRGVIYRLTMNMPDGAELSISYTVKEEDWQRPVLAAQLRHMRRVLRQRAESYMLGLRAC